MIALKVHDFNHEVDCIYKENKYTVRDNGAVLRHPHYDKRLRPLDNKWSFGKPCRQKGYLLLAGVPVHRIVATAFHGSSPTKEHVVDHIDTNRRNNRPENLRWVTRLENALGNPITRRRIEIVCGSVEDFLKNPKMLGNCDFDHKFKWMRQVSTEEAKIAKYRLEEWAKSDKQHSGGSLGEWIFKPLPKEKAMPKPSENNRNRIQYLDFKHGYIHDHIAPPYEEGLVMAKTLGAAQRKWNTPTEFPCCPQVNVSDPIKAYAESLKTGFIFSRNQFSSALILNSAVIDKGAAIIVMNESQGQSAIKPWSLAKITYENGLYVHAGLGTFFDKAGAEKHFCSQQGLEWTGGDTFDDFC